MLNKVFVYGTLMRGFSNYQKLLRKQKFNKFEIVNIEEAVFPKGKMYSFEDVYPVVIPGNDDIQGEIITFKHPSSALSWIDHIEVGYSRVKCQIKTQNGVKNCWVYLGNHNIYTLNYIPSGNWGKYIKKQ